MPIVNVDILEASVATPPSGSTTLFTDAGALKVKKDTGAVDVITEHRADNLTGTTLADNVVNSLLTSVGTLGVLGVTGTVTAGSFSGPLTGNVTGNVSGTSGSTTGNAATATALQTPRAINGTNFDGTGSITVTAAAGTLTGNTLAAGVTASSLTSLGTQTGLTCSGQVLLTFSGSVGAPSLEMSSALPILAFNETDQSANERRWAVGAIGKTLQFRSSTDDGSTSVIWATVTRGTGTAITNIAIGDTTNNNTYSFQSTGATTFNGAVTLTSLTTSGSAGVGVSPSVRMHVKGVASAETFRIETPNARGTGAVYASFYDSTGRKGYYGYAAASDVLFFMNELANSVHIGTNNLNRIIVDGSGNVTMPTDSVELRIGVGNDLRFSHDGTNSIIENNTGVLRILSGGDLRLEEGQVALQTVGKGLSIKEGTNAKMGVATLVAGTVVVSTTAVTANSRIFLTYQSLGTITVPSSLGVSARTAGTSFTILSADVTDTSVVAWIIYEPS